MCCVSALKRAQKRAVKRLQAALNKGVTRDNSSNSKDTTFTSSPRITRGGLNIQKDRDEA
jgi:hypothetical protein